MLKAEVVPPIPVFDFTSDVIPTIFLTSWILSVLNFRQSCFSFPLESAKGPEGRESDVSRYSFKKSLNELAFEAKIVMLVDNVHSQK